MREFRIDDKNNIYEKFYNEPGGIWIDVGKLEVTKSKKRKIDILEKINFFLKNYKNFNLKYKERILINGRLIIV